MAGVEDVRRTMCELSSADGAIRQPVLQLPSHFLSKAPWEVLISQSDPIDRSKRFETLTFWFHLSRTARNDLGACVRGACYLVMQASCWHCGQSEQLLRHNKQRREGTSIQKHWYGSTASTAEDLCLCRLGKLTMSSTSLRATTRQGD